MDQKQKKMSQKRKREDDISNEIKKWFEDINPGIECNNLSNSYTSPKKEIEILNIDYNFIVRVPKEIEKLVNLTFLSLASNQIRQLPSEIGNLTHLEKLILIENQIEELPEEIGNLQKLNLLNLDSNRLTSISQSLMKLIKHHKLKRLSLNRNRLLYLSKDLMFIDQSTIIEITGNANLIRPRYSKFKKSFCKFVFLHLNRGVLEELPSWENIEPI